MLRRHDRNQVVHERDVADAVFEPQPLHYEYCLYKHAEIPQHNPTNAKYKLLIETWRRMPIGLANFLGPYLVRSLG